MNIKYVFCLCSFLLFAQVSLSAEPIATDADTVDSLRITEDSLYAKINRSFETIKPIIEKSCFDCHSNSTKEPWYFNIPGIHSLVTSHVKDGRKHLDFTDGFPFKTKDSQLGILHEIKEEIEEGDMPIFSYRIMHWGKLIEGDQQDSVFHWIDSTIALITDFQKQK